MKRTLAALLLVVVVATTADAATTKKKTHKAQKQATQEQTAHKLTGEAVPATHFKRERKQADPGDGTVVTKPGPIAFGPPVELQLKRAGSRRFDLRSLPQTKPIQQERADLPDPILHPVTIQGVVNPPTADLPNVRAVPLAPAPPPLNVFEGLDRFNWGAGSPPDTNGDVGPNNYIQTVNTSIGVFRKSDGFQQAAFTFNTFMSQGNFGNLCDTNNFGDPVVLYDTFEDRWIITDFAFVTDISGNVLAPSYQCFAASMTGDPISGGWNFYSIQITDALNDYPKFGIWPDGLYMSSNLFTFGAGSTYKNARAWAFNKAQMYAGSPTVKVVQFDIGGGDFTVVPSNARLQTGTPPPGRPNLFLSTELFLNALAVYKFHVDWNSISLSTFTGPDIPATGSSWPNASVQNAGQPSTTMLLDTLQIRAMVQNQYTNFGGTESLWLPHTVRRANTLGVAAPRWYQVNVTGGTVASPTVQTTTWDPDGANVTNRFMPSLAVDRAGNMVMGYSVSSAVNEALNNPAAPTSPTLCTTCVDKFPSIMYAGRLAADPINTFSLTEQTFFTGTASQTGINRWGDYSAMTLDPDGCTFWYTSEYANPADQTFNHRWRTKFGSITPFPGCTPVGAGGTVSGTVTVNPGGAPIGGATVNLGARSTATDGSGNYAFTGIPAGTYSSMTASKPGSIPGSASGIVVTDGGTTTQNFSLTAAPPSACLTDTTQADFLTGVGTNVDFSVSPGDVKLASPNVVDQQNESLSNSGNSLSTASWRGQIFKPAIGGKLISIDVNLFALLNAGSTTPSFTASIRATAAGVPTGPDLVSTTVTGFDDQGAGGYHIADFSSSSFNLTAGTSYAFVIRPVANPSNPAAGPGYFFTVSSGNPYANGTAVRSVDGGSTWSISTFSGGFHVLVNNGFSSSGSFVSNAKDANPSGSITPIWSTFSWNGATPANTTLTFQLAGSNNANGPYSFVGPDGTAGTFFANSPVQLQPQFYNFRYLEYKAFLANTDSTVTPTLNDTTICFNDVDCSAPIAITPTPAQVCSNTTGNTASGPAGATSYTWGITNGAIVGSTTSQSVTYTAGASGSVGLTLNIVDASGCQKTTSTSVTINPNPVAPITISNLQTLTVTGASGTFTLTFNGQTTAPLAFNASAASVQAALNALSSIGGAGGSTAVNLSSNIYTVTFAGTLTGAQPQMTSAGSGGAAAFVSSAPVCANSLGNHASGPPGAATYAWTITNGAITSAANVQIITYTAGPSGSSVTLNLTVTNLAGCTASSAPANVPIVLPPPTPTVTPGGATTFCVGGSVTLTSSSASGNQWYDGTTVLAGQTNQTYIANSNGNYNVVVTVSGCPSAPSVSTSVTVNQPPGTPTISGTLAFCTGGNTTLFSDSSVGNQWYLGGNPIVGANGTNYLATQGGSYTVQVTDGNGCVSAMSAPAVVVVNSPPPTPTIAGTDNSTGTHDQACPEVPLTLTATSAGATSFQWYQANNTLNGETNATYQATGVGPYFVTATANGCTSAKSAGYDVQNPTPHSPFVSFRNQPSTTTSLAICQGTTQIIDSDSATGIHWWKDGVDLGPGNQSLTVTQAGVYTAQLNALGCHSQFGRNVTVTVNPLPATPTATPGGPTTFCAGGSVTLTSNSASGNQWFLNGSPIGGATNQSYPATASGSYTVKVTDASPCTSAASNAVVVTVNPIPATPTITPGGPTTFCSGGNVTLTSSSASGNQWYLNGNPIGGQTNQQYVATAAGSYTVKVTASGCTSAASAATVVTVNPNPNATITAAASTPSASTGNIASVANAGAGATYAWSVTNGTLTGGNNTPSITYTAGGVGTLTLNVTVTTSAGCSDAKSANVNVGVPLVTVTSVSPTGGTIAGGSAVTVNGTGFAAGASVTFGGSAATNVVVVSAIKITARTPAHALGAVDVTVTNTNASTATLTNGYLYKAQQFDPNNDGTISPLDIFYLVNYLYMGGPAPMGAAGVLSGDANGDGVVNPLDIFYLVNYLFLGGPRPNSISDGPVTSLAIGTDAPHLAGSIGLGKAVLRDGHYFVPVIMTAGQGSVAPQAMSLRVHFEGEVGSATVRKAGAAKDLAVAFETDRFAGNDLSYLVSYGNLVLGTSASAVVAEIQIESGNAVLTIDPQLTMLSNQAGTMTASVSNGKLQVTGTKIGTGSTTRPRTPGHEVN